MIKNTDEKRNSETSADTHGRMESIDQSLRSVDNRLRAVEKRLSGKKSIPGSNNDMIVIEEMDRKDIDGVLVKIEKSLEVLLRSVDEIRNESLVKDIAIRLNNLQAEIAKLNNKKGTRETEAKTQIDMINFQEKVMAIEQKLIHFENLTNETHVNKITIGKIKVPLEFSGLVASFVLLGTGILIYTNHWSIIRSSYYPITIGLLFGAVVVLKFAVTNRT
ncbi:MAG: hypothetical protein J5U17_08875 [Candidatus Methanoperedens sp.]|nr:hypothetical protein [Candidatus Methanoperedens sp.]